MGEAEAQDVFGDRCAAGQIDGEGRLNPFPDFARSLLYCAKRYGTIGYNRIRKQTTTEYGNREVVMAKYCVNCGNMLQDGDRFCDKCGTAVRNDTPAPAVRPPARQDRTAETQPLQAPPQRAFSPYQTADRTVATAEDTLEEDLPEINREHFFPSGGGELVVNLSSPRRANAKTPALPSFGPQGWTSGVVGTLFGGLGSLLTGFFKVFAHARALIFTAAISALWIWLNHQRVTGNTDELVENLSRLTYAIGGTEGSVVEMIGGALGKGVVGAGLCSVLYGGIAKLFRGVKNIFAQPGFNLGAAMIGFSLAAAAYQFTAGFAEEDGFMVGLMGAMLSLEALDGKKGFLPKLSAAFSSRKVGTSGKELLSGRFKGFLTGAAAGFVGWGVLCGTGSAEEGGDWIADTLYSSFDLDLPEGLIPYLIPVLLLLVGLILNAVGKGRRDDPS